MRKLETPERIETLSDAIFGLALTFLVVKLEIPNNFEDFTQSSYNFVGFFLTFLMLFYIWHKQCQLLRSISYVDNVLKTLIAVFLFLILYYVFPLKYLFTLSVEKVFEEYITQEKFFESLTLDQIRYLIKIYGLTVGAIFFLNAFMFMYCLFQQGKLALRRDKVLVWQDMVSSFITALFAVISYYMAGVLSPQTLHYTGLVYILIIPCMFISNYVIRQLFASKQILTQSNTVS